MASLKDLRKRIASIISTQQITRAMKLVSAAKLRKAQERIVTLRPYENKLSEVAQYLRGSVDEHSEVFPLFQPRPVRRVLMVLVTSDKGLCGAYNSQLTKFVKAHMDKNYPDPSVVDFIAVGQKGLPFLRKNGYQVVRELPHFLAKFDFDKARQLADELVEMFLAGRYDRIEIAYNRFKNALVYIPSVDRFLPIPEAEAAEETKVQPNFLFEPSEDELLKVLIPKILRTQLFRIFADATTAEHGARMTAMDNATENASELIRALRIEYNKARQAAITKELSEIIGGANALEG